MAVVCARATERRGGSVHRMSLLLGRVRSDNIAEGPILPLDLVEVDQDVLPPEPDSVVKAAGDGLVEPLHLRTSLRTRGISFLLVLRAFSARRQRRVRGAMRRNVGIDKAWPIHGRELVTAQENQVRGQPSALVDPVPDLKWIHGIQALRCFGIGYPATVRSGIPGGVKFEPGAGRHAYPVIRNRTENDSAI